MPKLFIPAAQLIDPDSRFGGGLQYARNVLPAYGAWRSLRRRSVQTKQLSISRPITGSYQHIYTAEQGLQFLNAALTLIPYNLGTNARLSDDNIAGEFGFSDFDDYVGGGQADDAKFAVIGGGIDGEMNLFLANQNQGIVVPSSTSNWKLRIRYKVEGNTSGTWEANFRLMEIDGTELIASTAMDSDTTSGSGGWVTFVHDFTGNLSWEIEEGFNVKVSFVTTASNQIVVPTSETNTNNWVNAAGSSTNIYQSIDEGSSASDADYVKSPVIGTSGVTDYTVNLVAVEPYFHASATVSGAIKVRWKKPQAGGQLSWTLLQDTTTIASGDIGTTAAQAAFTTTNIDLTAAEWNSISDFTLLKLKLTFTGGAPGGSVVTTQIAPNGVSEAGTWGSSTGGDVVVGDINANGGDYAQSPHVSGGPGSGFQIPMEIAFADYTFPGFNTDHTFKIDTDTSSASATVSNLTLRAGSQVLYNDDIDFPTSEATQTVTLDAADVSKMQANPADLTMELAGLRSAEVYNIVVDYARFDVPVPMEVYVSNVYLDFAPRAFGAVSWVQLETPIGDTAIIDDRPTLYAGDKEKLYTVDLVAGFTDVSQAGDYAQATNLPRAWRFAQWGNDIIATNYVDPVQIRVDQTGDFADMITSTAQPKARFVAAVRDQVWLGDTTDHASASADGVWWSAIDDAADFDPSATTLCSLQRLRQTPGQVMGLVGGEYAVIFKRESIYRADFIGPPEIYGFKVLEYSEGAWYPRSIVPMARDIYFHNGSGFLVLREGKAIEYIEPPAVNKYFDDKRNFPGTALFPLGEAELGLEDNSVIGCNDHHSGLIFWVIRNATNSALRSNANGLAAVHNTVAVYDTKRGRWSDLALSDYDITEIMGRIQGDVGESHVRNLLGFSFEDAADYGGSANEWAHTVWTLSDTGTEAAEIQTAFFQLREGVTVTLTGVRPVLVFQPEGTDIELTVTVTASDSPSIAGSSAAASTALDEHGWYRPASLSGEFFSINLTIPESETLVLSEIVGIELEFSEEESEGG